MPRRNDGRTTSSRGRSCAAGPRVKRFAGPEKTSRRSSGCRRRSEQAESIGFEPLAARARRSLRLAGVRVSSPARSSPAGGLALTPRESELVRLVDQGLNNLEIARRLGLGRPTVARMLASAMGKLGVERRTQLAAHELV